MCDVNAAPHFSAGIYTGSKKGTNYAHKKTCNDSTTLLLLWSETPWGSIFIWDMARCPMWLCCGSAMVNNCVAEPPTAFTSLRGRWAWHIHPPACFKTKLFKEAFQCLYCKSKLHCYYTSFCAQIQHELKKKHTYKPKIMNLEFFQIQIIPSYHIWPTGSSCWIHFLLLGLTRLFSKFRLHWICSPDRLNPPTPPHPRAPGKLFI